jgi:hypothetical protein
VREYTGLKNMAALLIRQATASISSICSGRRDLLT